MADRNPAGGARRQSRGGHDAGHGANGDRQTHRGGGQPGGHRRGDMDLSEGRRRRFDDGLSAVISRRRVSGCGFSKLEWQWGHGWHHHRSRRHGHHHRRRDRNRRRDGNRQWYWQHRHRRDRWQWTAHHGSTDEPHASRGTRSGVSRWCGVSGRPAAGEVTAGRGWAVRSARGFPVEGDEVPGQPSRARSARPTSRHRKVGALHCPSFL